MDLPTEPAPFVTAVDLWYGRGESFDAYADASVCGALFDSIIKAGRHFASRRTVDTSGASSDELIFSAVDFCNIEARSGFA
jgi:hypothetical protein